jgi:hypothetical protein
VKLRRSYSPHKISRIRTHVTGVEKNAFVKKEKAQQTKD